MALFTARRGFLPGEDLPWAEEYRRRLEEIRLAALECYAAVALRERLRDDLGAVPAAELRELQAELLRR